MLKIKSANLAKYQTEVEALYDAVKNKRAFPYNGQFSDGTAYQARSISVGSCYVYLTVVTSFGQYQFLVE